MFKVTQEDGVPDEVGSKHDVAGAHLRHAVRQSHCVWKEDPLILRKRWNKNRAGECIFILASGRSCDRILAKCDLPAHSGHTNNVPVLLKPLNGAQADGTRVSLWGNGLRVRDAGVHFQPHFYFYLFESSTPLIFAQHHVEEDWDGGFSELSLGDKCHLQYRSHHAWDEADFVLACKRRGTGVHEAVP